ncbi:hypothetical protein KM043_012505 [Ampulex compressa]|nr:hypothetical protein KM043_012505 [Ampulex compressa]
MAREQRGIRDWPKTARTFCARHRHGSSSHERRAREKSILHLNEHFQDADASLLGRGAMKIKQQAGPRRRKSGAVSAFTYSGPVDKYYPFTRSLLTDKPIIRHSALTSQLFYQSAPPGLLVRRRNDSDNIFRAVAAGEKDEEEEREKEKEKRKREEEEEEEEVVDTERREAKRGCSTGRRERRDYNSTKHNPRVNLTSPGGA